MADINDRLTNKEAERQIHDIAKFGDVIPLPHCYKRMRQKHYDINDIIKILTEGKIRKSPVYDEEFCNWEYNVEGHAIEGDEAVVVVTFESHRELACITVKPK